MPSPLQVLSRLTAAGVTGGLLLTGLTTVPASADDRPLPPGRVAKHYTVRPGDTATGLAVRFHAWTAELISHNHLGSSAHAPRRPADRDPGGPRGGPQGPKSGTAPHPPTPDEPTRSTRST